MRSREVFGNAPTLLVIEIRAPGTIARLLGLPLRQLWSSYLAYGLFLCAIGFVWVVHHSKFRRIRDVDRARVILHLELMGCVAFSPFSTVVLARYSFAVSSSVPTAAALYSINVLVIGRAFMSLWIDLLFRPSFVGGVDRATIQHTILRAAPPSISYALTAALAFVNPKVCYVLWTVATVYVAAGRW